MKNLKQVSKASQNINSRDRLTWLTLFYSYEKDSVYTTSGQGRYKVTDLINPNTEKDIQDIVAAWKRL